MSRYLLIHKDHPLRVSGINAGAEMATLHLARFLAKRGEEVYVAGCLPEGEIEQDGVQFWDIGEGFDVESAIIRIREKGDYHLLSAGRSQPFLFTKDDPSCLTRILISHDRAATDSGINPRALCSMIDRVVCVSDAQRQIFLDAGAPEEKIITIRNGVDLDLFEVGDAGARDWKKLVFVGALVPDKGLDLLLVSYAELKAKYPEISLDVYGSADLWGREEIYDTADLESKLPGLTFHGKVPQEEISKAFQSAGICVVPSIWFDPFPLTALEAQVTGCPVVTFNVGGLPEGIKNGETGIVVDEISDQALTQALESLLKDDSSIRELSQNAVEAQREYFTWERVADELQKLQAKILEERAIAKIAGGFSASERVGMMTTWNQQCGLATYAKALTAEWPHDSYSIFSQYREGEYAANNFTGKDEPFVTHCWNWDEAGWDNLVSSVVDSGVRVLLVNAHNPKELSDSSFEDAVNALQAKGIRVVILLHTLFTLRSKSKPVLLAADHIVVHTSEMKLEAASYGVSSDNISVIAHGVEVLPELEESESHEILRSLGLPADVPIISSIGFIQPHKGLEALLEAVRTLRDEGIHIHACIAGSAKAEDEESVEYAKKLRSLSLHFHIENQVTFIERFITEDEITNLLQVSDAVVMNYSSEHYECSGACSKALGAGANVITSMAPAFHSFGSAVWHSGLGFSVPLTVREVLQNESVQEILRSERQKYISQNKWSQISPQFLKVLERFKAIKEKEQPVAPENTTTSQAEKSSLRVLIQNRSNMFSQRGGDTIVIEQLAAGLQEKGISVDIDLEAAKEPADYDIVHLINFALPQMIEVLGQRAQQAGTPFVVTTLCEDVPSFHNQSRILAEVLVHYTQTGQNPDWLKTHFEAYQAAGQSDSFNNFWAAENAAHLMVNGAGEEKVIDNTYPGHAPVSIVPVGYELQAQGNRELFINEYGIEDFILCVGRLESRKNQMMLQLALEHVDIPVVYAAGGFTYQPDYADGVKNFKRKGNTLVLERLSSEMLASAYLAAKVHALPSWYELPGLVSLEAGVLGCNLVAANTGTTKDYLGEFGFYCEPDDPDSIRNAVLAAYYSPYRPEIGEHLKQFSWEAATEKTIAVYEEVLGTSVTAGTTTIATISEPQASNEEEQTSQESAEVPASDDGSKFEEVSRLGFEAAQERRFEDAHRFLAEAEQINPKALRVLCNRAAVFLAEEKLVEAKGYFARARKVDASDSKAQSGYAMCLMMEGNKEEAHGHFLEILKREPTDMMAILQLLDCSYALDRYDDLEGVLKRLLEIHPENFDMRFCLAGCLMRQNKLSEALAMIEILLTENPQHGGSLELRQALDEMIEEQGKQQNSVQEQPVGNPVDQAIEKLVDARKSPDKPRSFDSIDVRLGELEELKHRKLLDEAIAGIDEILQRKDLSEHQKKSAELLRAEVNALMGNREEAKEVFATHNTMDPNCPRALCGLAAIAASYNELSDARELFERALENAPLYDKALAGVGFCDYYSGDQRSAWERYCKALDANPENLSALLGTIQLAYQLDYLPELEARLELYLEMHPADLDMVYAYAGCLYAQSRLDEAHSEVEKILLFKPDDERAAELRDIIDGKSDSSSIAVSSGT